MTRVLNSISNTNKPKTRNSEDKVGKLIAGTICGTLLGTTLIVAVLYCTYRRCRRPPQTQEPPIPMNIRQEPAWITQERIDHGERLGVIGSNVILSEQNETEM